MRCKTNDLDMKRRGGTHSGRRDSGLWRTLVLNQRIGDRHRPHRR